MGDGARTALPATASFVQSAFCPSVAEDQFLPPNNSVHAHALQVKDGKLYVGSYGKEYTDVVDGVYTVVKSTNLWISVINKHGHVEHRNWVKNYGSLLKVED